MKKLITLLILLFIWTSSSWATVSTYTFAGSSGTYTPLSTETVLWSASFDDEVSTAITIPSFTYDGTAYTTMYVSANGWLTLGSVAPSGYVPISGTGTYAAAIAPYANDLQQAGSGTPKVSYNTNSGGNIVVQWQDVRRYGTSYTTHSLSFQAILNPTTKTITFVYGGTIAATSGSATLQVGLRGTSNADYANRTTTTAWASTTAGTLNSSTCTFSSTVLPAVGQTFTFTPPAAGTPLPPTTPSPADAAVNVPVSGSTTWTFGTNTTTYDLKFGPTGSMTQVVTGAAAGATGTYTYSGLSTNAFYQWQVIEHNGAITTSGPVWSFFTVCGTYSVPYTENFDLYTPPAVGCGTVIDVNADTKKWVSSAGSSYDGANKLSIGYSAVGVTMDDWYIGPGLNLTGGISYDLKFYYHAVGSTFPERLEVKWGNAATVAGMTSAAIFSQVDFTTTTYTLGAASFTPATTGVYYIGWHCYSQPDEDGIYLDNITVIPTPPCPAPLTVTASAITSTGASIGWTGTAPNVQIDYGSVGHSAGTGTLVSSSTNPQPITSLTPSTSYDVFVRRDCGAGLYSTWTGPVTFTTACAAVSSVNENFDAAVVPALPNCWKSYISPSFSFETVLTYTTGPNTAPNCVQLYSSGATLAADAPMLISPALTNLSAHTYQLRFNAKGASTNLSVIVGTMSDPTNSATFVPFATVSGLNTTTYTQCIVSFAAYSGTNTYIAFQHPLTTTYSYIYIDDVVWEPLPPCPQPVSPVATNIALTSANLTWTPGGSETAWQYVYGLSPLPTPSGAGTPSTSSTVNPITGLTPYTNYQFYVRANCGSSLSAWTGPISFYTGYCIPAPTSVDGSGITNVNFGSSPNIVNNTTVAETGNYGDYSAQIGNVQRTVSIPVNITFATGYTYDTKIWVDWNDNLSFLDAGEEVYVGTSLATNPTTLAASFTVPLTAPLGNHRMRIGGVDVGPPTPCYTGSYGTFEDYTVNVLAAPSCLQPTALNATGITTTSANLTWTPGGTETAWQYVFGVSPLPAPTGAGTATTSATVNPITVVASTTYQYYVRANCGSSFSAWSGPYTFSTPCGAVSVPYTQNFDAVTAPAIPNCMLVTDDNADLTKWLTSTAAPRSTPNSMRISYNSAAAMNDWFFTPGLTLTPGTYKVSFWYHSSGASYPEALEVKWGATQSAAGMTNGPIFTNNNIIASTYVQGTANMVVTAAGTYYVGWHGFSAADMYYIVVDDISIKQALNHDVSTASINNIPAVYDPTPVTPKATVTNLGLNTETFTVTATIGAYTSTKTVTALAPDASAVVTFDLWTPTVGAFTAQVCTNLGTDQDASNNCKSVTGTVFNYTRFYAYIAYGGTSGLPEGPGFFYKEAPGTVVSLAPTTSDVFICAGTWASGKWFASEYYDTDNTSPTYLLGGGWYTIDPTDGSMTKAASLGRSFTGITYDHTTNTMYGVDYDDVALTNKLYTIDKSTGAATFLGNVAPGELLINLATDGSGFLYSLGISTDHLFKINTVGTPVATDIGSAGILMSYAQDMEYDYASSTMYAPAYLTASTSGLYTVNLTTGACTLVGALAGDAELCGFAIPYTDSKTLNLTSVFLEGLYAGSGTMNTAALHVPPFAAGVADLITVELHNPTTYSLAVSIPNVVLSTTGTATVSVPATYSGSYHITIKHRNSIETTTLTPVSFAGSTINQAFTVGNVYGGNLGLMAGPGTYYAIYAGDVDQNGTVDSGDFTPVDNDASLYLSGYLATDVNGDGGIDTGDFTAVDNNGLNYVSTSHP